MGPGNITPIFVCAIMTFSKIGHSLVNLSLSSPPNLRSIASDHLVRSGHKAIFVPLVTTAGLPALPADIAVEVSKLHGNKRRARYQNSALQGQLQFRSVDIQ